MQGNYAHIEKKLKHFRAKFYQNLLYRGLILCLGITASYLLLLSVFEFFGEFSKITRSFLFYSFLLVALTCFSILIIVPLFRMLNIAKGLNEEDAAKLIGEKLDTVNDKLLNLLQLYKIAKDSNNPLALASVEQKSKVIETEDFSKAINVKSTFKLLQFLLYPSIIALLIGMVSPAIFSTSAKRILAFNSTDDFVTHYAIELLDPKLEAKQNDDFNLRFKLKSNVQVSSLTLKQNGIPVDLFENELGYYEYTFKNVQKSFDFEIVYPDQQIENIRISVLERAVLKKMLIDITPPAYTKLDRQQLISENSLEVPEGSLINFLANTKNTTSISIIKPFTKGFEKGSNNTFKNSVQAITSATYQLAIKSKSGLSDTLNYNVNIIKDQFPNIAVQTRVDSTNLNTIYLAVNISDDYGFSKLIFMDDKGVLENAPKTILKQNLSTQEVYITLDLNKLVLNNGAIKLRVYDNDGVNGAKFSDSKSLEIKKFSKEDLKAESNKASSNILEKLKQSKQELKEVNKGIDALKKKLLQQDKANWGDKQQLKKLLNKQSQTLNTIEELKKDQKTLSRQKENNLENSEEILQKQERLNELFDELLDEETKKLQEELQKTIDSLNQDDLLKTMEQIEMNNEDLNKELDRNLELFKKFDLEQKAEELTKDLKNLAEEQKALSEKDKETNTSKKQEELNKKFDALKKELSDIKKENKELENPLELPDTKKKEEEITKEQQDAKENLDQKKQNKAKEQQKKASEKMEEMQQEMESSMSSSSSEKEGEDAEALRQILDNLLSLSISEESLMQSLNKTRTNDPYYLELTKQQKKNIDDSKIIQDSLFALSKRVPQISNVVNREISAVKENFNEAINHLEERQTSQAVSEQQYGITALNNLALLLDEALDQLQKQMKSKSSGSGNCKKPGEGKPKPGDMKKMQEELQKQLEGMKKGLEKGKKPSEGGEGGMSMEMAKAAAKQAVIRQKLKELSEQYEKDGNKGMAKNLHKIEEEMDKAEEDLYNKKLDVETMKRQREIVSRLLEAEEADRKQGDDEKRESNSANETPAKKAEDAFKKSRTNENSQDLIQTLPAELKPYYKNKVNTYIQE